LRLKQKGIPRRVGVGRGDQLTQVTIEIPQKITDAQRALIEQLAKELGEEVQPQRRTFMEKLKDLFG
jgi:molecular chaperone DnaJ